MPYKKSADYLVPLEAEQTYHIFNRGIDGQPVFFEPAHYYHFLRLLRRYIVPCCAVFAYCLLPNHFHLLVSTLAVEQEEEKPRNAYTQAFSNLFNAYTKAINKQRARTGSLWQRPFRRTVITQHEYFLKLIHYIHANPVHHGLAQTIDAWAFSSYSTYLSQQPTALQQEKGLAIIGGRAAFAALHRSPIARKEEGYYLE